MYIIVTQIIFYFLSYSQKTKGSAEVGSESHILSIIVSVCSPDPADYT